MKPKSGKPCSFFLCTSSTAVACARCTSTFACSCAATVAAGNAAAVTSSRQARVTMVCFRSPLAVIALLLVGGVVGSVRRFHVFSSCSKSIQVLGFDVACAVHFLNRRGRVETKQLFQAALFAGGANSRLDSEEHAVGQNQRRFADFLRGKNLVGIVGNIAHRGIVPGKQIGVHLQGNGGDRRDLVTPGVGGIEPALVVAG